MVLYPILLRAICIAATPTDAEQIITDYRSTCGLIAITRVLASAPYVISANDLATLKQATTNLRNEVCDVVIHDLTTDRAPDQRTGTTPLTFVGYLDEEMWEQMRQIIDPMIRSGGITQGDLAARFVSTYSEQEIRSFHREEFEKLVPRESWRADQFPEDDGTLPLEDTTLVSLAMYAARVVRPILEAE
ncbi:hypothetical protein GS449_26885 [Rhodococcus hoagii]|nr:hypothetical protein [Prescottella equi]